MEDLGIFEKQNFIDAIKPKEDEESFSPSVMNGTVVKNDNGTFVKIDGSESLTPVSSDIDIDNGERVTVSIVDHKGVITGSVTSPAAQAFKIIKTINNSVEEAAIEADKININGVTSINEKFKVNLDGSMEATGAKISGDVDMYTEDFSGFTWLKRIGAKFENEYFKIYAVSQDGTERELWAVGPGEASSAGPHIYTDYPFMEMASDIQLGGQISTAGKGGRYVSGRDNAIIRNTSNDTSSYFPIFSSKTPTGSWEIGVVNETLRVTYLSDSDYNSGKNSPLIYSFHNDGGLTLASHDSKVGTVSKKSSSTAVSIPNNAWADVNKSAVSVTLGAGSYVATASVAFASAAGGKRAVRIMSGSSQIDGSQSVYAGVSTSQTVTCQTTTVFSLTSQSTISVQAFQNIGSALNATSVSLQIVRVA